MTRPHLRSKTVALSALALVAAPLAVASTPTSAAADGPRASTIAVAWQRIAIRTIFTETVPTPGPPVGALYLSFTSLAVHHAAKQGQRQGRVTASAAVATAAHDVLWEYFPASRAHLDADLATTLEGIPDGAKEDAGIAIGAAAADDMIASRVGDGRGNASIVYSQEPGPGVWQPPVGGGMALAWFGFLKPVIDVPTVTLDGPDPLGSAAYARDYNEVKRVGRDVADLADRSAEQTAIARFFAGTPVDNAVGFYRDALCRYLDAHPLGLLPTTRLFARIDAAVTTAFIQTWRLKYDVGFWRPFQAISGQYDDNNPATEPQPGWAPLIPNPAYSDYTSGHAAATAPFAEVLRQKLGDDTPLVLHMNGQERSYATLSALEHDALNARIWGGLHFRDAMDDGYYLGHTVADEVIAALR
ncbi:vanadium-dependent haloperoxidase [Nocardioides taihuensis]|uniref:Vanadium-dependent haloperoxidase n=1 Tax=Nocardioides taihuensis TaxID=1835606 RepID=A0ABW0BG43_9ACTN